MLYLLNLLPISFLSWLQAHLGRGQVLFLYSKHNLMNLQTPSEFIYWSGMRMWVSCIYTQYASHSTPLTSIFWDTLSFINTSNNNDINICNQTDKLQFLRLFSSQTVGGITSIVSAFLASKSKFDYEHFEPFFTGSVKEGLFLGWLHATFQVGFLQKHNDTFAFWLLWIFT